MTGPSICVNANWLLVGTSSLNISWSIIHLTVQQLKEWTLLKKLRHELRMAFSPNKRRISFSVTRNDGVVGDSKKGPPCCPDPLSQQHPFLPSNTIQNIFFCACRLAS